MRLKLHFPNTPPRAKVGDTVYYRSPINCFAIKRSVVVEIRNGYEQVMQNGDIIVSNPKFVIDDTTFPTLEAALSHIQATLIRRINNRQVSIDTLLHEQAAEKNILLTMIKQYPDIEPGNSYLKQADSNKFFFQDMSRETNNSLLELIKSKNIQL